MPVYPSPSPAVPNPPGYPTGHGPSGNPLEVPENNSNIPGAGSGKIVDPSGGSSSGDADDYITTQQTGNESGGAPPSGSL